MKAGLCIAGQLSNLTKSKKKKKKIKKKKMLFGSFFMAGKQIGKKKTPNKVLMLLRNKLQPKDYVRLPSF